MGKLTRPHFPEFFPRRRLFAALDRMRQHSLIWVSGPGGCGKTTLVGSHLQARGTPCLWYQIEEGDKDPAIFFYYLSQAVQKAFPRRKTRLPLFTPEYFQSLPTFSQNFLKEWVKGSHISLERNSSHFRKGLPYLDGIKISVGMDLSSFQSAVF